MWCVFSLIILWAFLVWKFVKLACLENLESFEFNVYHVTTILADWLFGYNINMKKSNLFKKNLEVSFIIF